MKNFKFIFILAGSLIVYSCSSDSSNGNNSGQVVATDITQLSVQATGYDMQSNDRVTMQNAIAIKYRNQSGELSYSLHFYENAVNADVCTNIQTINRGERQKKFEVFSLAPEVNWVQKLTAKSSANGISVSEAPVTEVDEISRPIYRIEPISAYYMVYADNAKKYAQATNFVGEVTIKEITSASILVHLDHLASVFVSGSNDNANAKLDGTVRVNVCQ